MHVGSFWLQVIESFIYIDLTIKKYLGNAEVPPMLKLVIEHPGQYSTSLILFNYLSVIYCVLFIPRFVVIWGPLFQNSQDMTIKRKRKELQLFTLVSISSYKTFSVKIQYIFIDIFQAENGLHIHFWVIHLGTSLSLNQLVPSMELAELAVKLISSDASNFAGGHWVGSRWVGH